MLIVFAGLPGTGKTTIASAVAARCAATFLRIDIIEQAMRNGGLPTVGASGYAVANALAASNLAIGRTVIADCVNPVRESREGWWKTAVQAGKPLVDIEIICSDPAEHRRRVETRRSDIEGLVVPTWQAILDRCYEPWDSPRLVIDTAHMSASEATAIIERHLGQGRIAPSTR